MAKDNKFGTFGGVYTPSVLTILGVIMYLRLPWVVGHAGLYVGLAIILVAHMISVSTGLSISSIATDKSVGAGGPYYIVSRSLGLPIGGTLGLALFIGLAFSISLYVIGFSESMLHSLGFEATKTNIRICGSVTLVLLASIAVISTAVAIKTQYVIFGLIAVSLIAIFLGSPAEVPPEPALAPAENGASVGELFAIFFPAVTGFTAGVNMSGDLRRPKQSIPRGTMAAIATGLVVYVGLAVFLAFRVNRAALIESSTLLQDVALEDWMVIGGIWGATLSSALGSILGAPRILQAVSADGITPRLFARGVGPSKEPRNALILSFVIALGGILIAELDAIARIVSMVFLTTYGFLNISCAIESWASPDFRPDFRIPKTVSIVGAVTCLLVMIQLDLLAMAGSVLLMAGLYAWLKRRQLRLDAGDAWEGFWASLVRSGLHRLSQLRRQRRNWRPNVLMFRARASGDGPLVQFAHSLVAGNGLLTDFKLTPRDTAKQAMASQATSPTEARPPPTGTKKADETAADKGKRAIHKVEAEAELEGSPVGVFSRSLPSDNPTETISGACRYHGFAGLSPNTVLLDWEDHKRKPAELSRLIRTVSELDYNTLILSNSSSLVAPATNRIDVWWRPGAGNFSLSVALVRFITAADQWRQAEVRFLLLSEDTSNNDILRTRARRVLADARVEASIKVLNNTLEARRLADWVQQESHDSKLCIMGLTDEAADNTEARLDRFDRLLESLNSTLLIRGNSSFEEVLSLGRVASRSLLPPRSADSTGGGIGAVTAGDNAMVIDLVEQQREAYEAVVLAFQEHGIARVYTNQISLLRSLRDIADKQFTALEKGLAEGNPTKHRKLINRLQSAFVMDARKQLQLYVEHTLPEQRATLDGRIESFTQDEAISAESSAQLVHIAGTKEEFDKNPDDPPSLASFKRRRRMAAVFRRRNPTYPVPLQRLRRFYYDRLQRDCLREAVRRVTADSHQLAVHLGKLLNSGETSLTLLGGLGEEQILGSYLQEQRERTLKHYDGLIAHERQQVAGIANFLKESALELVQDYANDLQALDIRSRARKQRKPDKRSSGVRGELDESATLWFQSQGLLYERAQLGLSVSGFQHRLAAIVQREKEALELELRSGTLKDYQAFYKSLGELKQHLEAKQLEPSKIQKVHFDAKPRFEPAQFIDRLLQETDTSTQELPESVETLSDEAIEMLEERGYGTPELFQLSVRPLVKFLVESELIGGTQAALERFPPAERRATIIGNDVARLISFQLNEFEAVGEGKPEDFSAHMLPAVENGIERIEKEFRELKGLVETVVETVDNKLSSVLEATHAYELTRASDTLDQRLRLRRGREAVTGLRGLWRKSIERARQFSVSALYRGSAGLLLARNLRARPGTASNTVERVLALSNAHKPLPSALEKLPFYYRQLFFGQSALNETFWVERTHEVQVARQAISNYRRGSRGALLFVGERGSGKSALSQRIVGRYLERHSVFRIHPLPGGSADPAVFRAALSDALGHRAGPVSSKPEVFSALPEHSIIVIDDLELWWERSPNGNAVLDLILDLISQHSDHCLFVLCTNRFTFELISHMRPLADSALGVVECGPMPAEALKEVITLRHGSTGVQYEVDEVSEQALSQWDTARLFSSFHHYSSGLVGVALQAWISHVKTADKDRIVLNLPSLPNAEDLDELKVEQSALLLALCLHKQLHLSRLQHVIGGDPRVWRANLDTLTRMGLVEEVRPAVFEISRFVHHLVTERFRARGYLA